MLTRAALVATLALAWSAARADTVPLGALQTRQRVDHLRDTAATPWSTFTLTRTAASDFIYFWDEAWTDPAEFAPQLDRQSRDGPARSFADPRVAEVSGGNPKARDGHRWSWDAKHRLLTIAAAENVARIEAKATKTTEVRGPLCAVLIGLATNAGLRFTDCVARPSEGPEIALRVAKGEAWMTSVGAAVRATGLAWHVSLSRDVHGRAVLDATRLRGAALASPLACGPGTAFAPWLDALADGRTPWPDDAPPAAGCWPATFATHVLEEAALSRDRFATSLWAFALMGDERERAALELVPRLLGMASRRHAGRPSGAAFGRQLGACAADDYFDAFPQRPRAMPRDLAAELRRACTAERPRAAPPAAMP